MSFQFAVLMVRPLLAPDRQLVGAVPVPCLVAKALIREGAHRQHDMSMVIAFIALRARRVNGDISNHATGNKLLLSKRQNQLLALFVGQLVGLTPSTNKALAKGRTPLVPLEKQEVVNLIRSRQMAAINSKLERHKASVLNTVRQELAGFALQVSAYFQAEIMNRELALQRRKASPPEAGPVELWQGQVAALERSLAMARLNFSEAKTFIQEIAAGQLIMSGVQPCSVLLALITDE